MAAQERILWHEKLGGTEATQKRVHELVSMTLHPMKPQEKVCDRSVLCIYLCTLLMVPCKSSVTENGHPA
jgi:hypothetical protein